MTDPTKPLEESGAVQADAETGDSMAASGDDRSRTMRFSASTERVFDAARQEVRRKPIAYAAGAFAVGFVLAVVMR
jgi:hypothetical protein